MGKFDKKDWSPKAIHDLYWNVVKTARSEKRPVRVVRICDDAVVKRVESPSEVTVLKLVSKHTNIATQSILHDVTLNLEDDEYSYVVLKYIDGKTLAETWSTMSKEQKDTVIKTLRDYVVQLRNVKDDHFPTPGPLCNPHRVCEIHQFGNNAKGPFGNYAELTKFLNDMVALAKSHRACGPIDGEFNEKLPLVLTHNDLTMDNVMISEDGKIWLLDWGMSGYYPAYFEQFAMRHAKADSELPEDWIGYIPEVTDDYPKEIERLCAIQPALNLRVNV